MGWWDRGHPHQRDANGGSATVYEADVVGGGEGRGAVLAGDVRYERNLARRVTGGGSIDICGVAKKCNVT